MEGERAWFAVRSAACVGCVLAACWLLQWLWQLPGCVPLLLALPPALVLLWRVPPPPDAALHRLHQRLDRLRCGAHRGACLDAPENSLPALYRCVERGCELIEFDLSFTADDVPVIFHDDTVDRISDGSGRLDQLTWAQVKQLDIAAKLDNRSEFGATSVATLTEMVEACLRLDVLFIIDVKCYDERAVNAVLALYDQFPKMYELAMVSSFYPQLIYAVRRRNPSVVGCMAWRDYFFSYARYSALDGPSHPRHSTLPRHLLARVMDQIGNMLYLNVLPLLCGLSVMLLHKDDVTARLTNQLRARRLRILAWTVNDPGQKAFMAEYLGVPYLTDTLIVDPYLMAGNGVAPTNRRPSEAY